MSETQPQAEQSQKPTEQVSPQTDEKEQPPNESPKMTGEAATVATSSVTGVANTSIEIGEEQRQQQPAATSGGLLNIEGSNHPSHQYAILRRPIKYDPLSIVFALLVFIGGVIGYVSKGSSASLISGTVFGFLLAAATYLEGARKNAYPLLVTLFVLGSAMFYRYYQSGNFMIAGLISLLAFIMFARHAYLLYLRQQTA